MDNSKIASYISELSSKEAPADKKEKIIEELVGTFSLDRILICHYYYQNPSDFYKILIDLYLNQPFSTLSNKILNLIDILLPIVDCNKIIFNYIYQSISYYYFNQSHLTNEILEAYLILLQHLYRGKKEQAQEDPAAPQQPKIPKNFFYFTSGSQFKVTVPEGLFNLTGKGLTVVMWIRINNKISSNKEPGRLIALTSTKDEKISLKVSIYNNSFTNSIKVSQDNKEIIENNNNNFEIQNNKYMLFVASFTSQYISLSSSDFEDSNFSYNISPYEGSTVQKEFFDIITLCDNISCEVTSIYLLNEYYTQKEIDFKWLVQRFPYGVVKLSKVEEITAKIPFESIFSTYLPVVLDSKGFIDDLNGNTKGELFGPCGAHTYTKLTKCISKLGGIKNLLPIIEMIYTTNENNYIKITEETLYNYLELVNIIIYQGKYNIKDAEESNFFQVLSLFLEKFPAEVFDQRILEKLLEIKSSVGEETPLFKIIFDNLLLNERVYYKFPTVVQEMFWEKMSESLKDADINRILTFLPMSKICLLLKYYDEKRYFEYCCEEHKNAFIPGLNERIMNPNFKAKTEKLIDLVKRIVNKVDMSKSSDPIILFQLLSLDMSPCLMKILIQVFVNMFTNQDRYLQFKAGEVTDNAKTDFENIVINTLSRALPDVKGDLLYLLAMGKKGKKLDEEFVQGIFDNINLSEGFYITSTPQLGDSFIKELASHCANKVRNRETCEENCERYKEVDKTMILKKEYLEKNIKRIYDALLLLLLKKSTSGKKGSSEIQVNEDDDFFNEGIINVLINFVEKSNNEAFNLRLSRDLRNSFTKNYNNCYIMYSNKILYYWNINNMYNNFEKGNELFENSKEINFKIYINTILQDYKYKKVLQGYPTMTLNNLLTWGYQKKNGCDHLKVDKFITYIFNEYFSLLYSQNKEGNIENNIFQNIITLFSIYLDYATISNSNDEELSNEFLEFSNEIKYSKIVPHCFFNTLKLDENKKWVHFELLQKIFFIFHDIFNFEKINKYCGGQLSDNLVKKYETVSKMLLFTKENRNIFVKDIQILNYVFLSEFNWKLSKCLLIFLSVVLFLIDEDSANDYVENWVNEYKSFVLFYVIASSNIYPGVLSSTIETQINADCGNIVLFSLGFLSELFFKTKNQAFKSALKSTIQEITAISTIYTDEIKSNVEKSKKFKIKALFSKVSQKKDYTECGVYNLFSVQNDILTPERIEAFKAENFGQIPEVFNEESWETILFNNKIFEKRLRGFFNLGGYKEKIKLRKNPIVANPKGKNLNRADEIIKLIPKYQINISKYSNSSFMVIKEKRNMYKKIKKELFLWRGMWSNYDDLYQNKLKLKVLNHYTKFISRPLLIPILDIDYYVPNFTCFRTEKMFKETSINKIKLDIDDLLQSKIQETDQTNIINTDSTSNDMNYLNYIDFKNDKILYKLNLDFTKKIFLSKEEDFMQFFSQTRTLSKNENLRKHENRYECCFVKPSHHIKGVMFIDDTHIAFRVFINQIKGNNIISDEDFDESTSKKKETYDCGFDKERNTCFGSYFVYHHKDKDALTFKLSYDQITYLFRRRYYQRNTSIEFFSKNQKSYYFTFKTEQDRENALNDMLEHLGDVSSVKKIVVDLRKSNDEYKNVIGFAMKKKKGLLSKGSKKLSKLLKKWQSFKISNFEFLMKLNLYSNRSFSDLSQYPVFPWILTNYSDQTFSLTNDLRDLSLPMGMMALSEDGESRKRDYLTNYETLAENDEEMDDNPSGIERTVPYYYGSHYSNPIYSVHYLTRLFPYSHISIELQGDKFDNSDRLFLNIGNSFKCAASVKGDVRELISEFFYLPEMFLNINNLNLGETQEEISVENVQCPVWADSDPYKFVTIMRRSFESDEISMKINSWIDLIFGLKSRGRNAVEAFNMFYPDSYEIEIDKMRVMEEKVLKLRMVEFGVTPKQISSVEFPNKKKELFNRLLIDGYINWKCLPLSFKANNPVASKKHPKSRNLYGFKAVEAAGKIVALYREDNDIQVFKFVSTNTSTNLMNKANTLGPALVAESNSTLKIAESPSSAPKKPTPVKSSKANKHFHFLGKEAKYYDIQTNKKDPPIVFLKNTNTNSVVIAQGGFNHSKILFTVVDISYIGSLGTAPTSPEVNYFTFYVTKEPYPITALSEMVYSYEKKEKLLIAGNSIGNCFLISLSGLPNQPEIKVIKTLINNFMEITAINFSHDMNAFATLSKDGYINLYTVPLVRLFRSIYFPNHSCDKIFMSSSPLPCVAIFSEEESEIVIYSINGKYLSKIKEPNGFKSPKIVKDSNFCEYILYISARKVLVRSLPYLEQRCEISLTIRDPEVIDINEEMNVCYVGNMQGSEWVYIRNKEIDMKK